MLVISAVLAQTLCGVVALRSNWEPSSVALPKCEGELEQEEYRLAEQHELLQPLAFIATSFSLLADRIYSGRVVARRYLHPSASTVLLAACRAPPAR